MSREWIIKTLIELGFSQVEAEVYVFLTQVGPSNGREIATSLNLYKQKLYRNLKRLKCKDCIRATSERPARFSAVPIEEVLDQFMKTKEERAERLQASRAELLASWHSIMEKSSSSW
jgi:sugar-specific transcriptional regulator TrmB